MHPRIAFGQVGAYVQLTIHHVSQLSLKTLILGTGSHSVSSCMTLHLVIVKQAVQAGYQQKNEQQLTVKPINLHIPEKFVSC